MCRGPRVLCICGERCVSGLPLLIDWPHSSIAVAWCGVTAAHEQHQHTDASSMLIGQAGPEGGGGRNAARTLSSFEGVGGARPAEDSVESEANSLHQNVATLAIVNVLSSNRTFCLFNPLLSCAKLYAIEPTSRLIFGRPLQSYSRSLTRFLCPMQFKSKLCPPRSSSKSMPTRNFYQSICKIPLN